ncbi:hypothetical protein IW146_008563 [Coemansia sp. RSA 922]|nr:hypothetical protein IW146_008563 [Coemansia sp. RSA 922]
MDRHYLEVIAPATDRAPALSYPFPTHDMYKMALQAAAAHINREKRCLFRDSIRVHLDLVSNKYPLAAQRIAHVYAFHHNKA